PVITISRRKTARDHLLATDEQLAAAGVQLTRTDRGGDITYHGPGQLVVYPILDLNALRLRIHGYMRFLEQIVIDTLAEFGIDGRRDECATGVWVGSSPQKICAMGVRVSRWVSMHGLALNVTTNLDHFDLIVPCGLVGRTVTSMQRQLGDACPTLDQVKHSLISQFRIAIDRTLT
ncbi:MAG: lipoyl(octanoyl) transferase LipB, partial [Planctomycetes bacterium]|nr:lipoyl(octanoyl) transferase LipB [Planctomycetota bacterium]